MIKINIYTNNQINRNYKKNKLFSLIKTKQNKP